MTTKIAIAAGVAGLAAAFGAHVFGALSNVPRERQASGAESDEASGVVDDVMTAVVAVDSVCVAKPCPVPRALAEQDVLIRVVATAINRLDTMQRRGKSPVPQGVTDVLGLEVAGVVVARGAAARGFRVGDRVMALVPGGGYAEYVAVHTATVMHKPRALSWAQAAAVPEAWLTAALNLQLGRATAGETVLIHAAASGVGVAAIQLARAAGLRVLVTVGSADKLALATSLGAAGGAIRHNGPWLETVRALAPQGVDLILDCVAGSYAEQNLQSLALDGRWVLYSLLGGPALPPTLAPTFMAQLLKKRVQLIATTLRTRSTAFKRALVADFAKRTLPRLGGDLAVVIDREFDGLEQAQAAHEYMESNANLGKIVLHVHKTVEA